jgi:hypothetical protein
MFEELAKRVEALTGPCRETDAEIAFAQGWRMSNGHWWTPQQSAEARKKKQAIWSVGIPAQLPAFTASLDAAMTLVPEGCEWQIPFSNPWHARITRDGEVLLPLSRFGSPTPALALTAASLRARAAKDADNG